MNISSQASQTALKNHTAYCMADCSLLKHCVYVCVCVCVCVCLCACFTRYIQECCGHVNQDDGTGTGTPQGRIIATL